MTTGEREHLRSKCSSTMPTCTAATTRVKVLTIITKHTNGRHIPVVMVPCGLVVVALNGKPWEMHLAGQIRS
jgi:hypothetical protein